MDDKCKSMLIQALQETIRLKQEIWKLTDKLNKPNTVEATLNKTSRAIEIEEIQNRISKITGLA